MKYNELVAAPTPKNIESFVLDKLYFQGEPVIEGFVRHRDNRPGLSRSAIGHLLPQKVLKRLQGNETRATIKKLLKDEAPEALALFAKENEATIRRLEKLSRTQPEEGTAFRTVVQRYPGFVPFYKK